MVRRAGRLRICTGWDSDQRDDGAGGGRRGLGVAPIASTAPIIQYLDVHDEKQHGAQAPNHATEFTNLGISIGAGAVAGGPVRAAPRTSRNLPPVARSL